MGYILITILQGHHGNLKRDDIPNAVPHHCRWKYLLLRGTSRARAARPKSGLEHGFRGVGFRVCRLGFTTWNLVSSRFRAWVK